MTIPKEKYMNWLEAIQEYYEWSESEYHSNPRISLEMANTIDEMRLALVFDVGPCFPSNPKP